MLRRTTHEAQRHKGDGSERRRHEEEHARRRRQRVNADDAEYRGTDDVRAIDTELSPRETIPRRQC